MRYLYIFILFTILFSSCDKKEDEEKPDPVTPTYPSMLIIVENGIYNDIKSELSTYVEDIATGDTTALIIKWGTGTVGVLRDTLKKYYNEYNISGAFLIGDLPVAWYEMDASVNFGDYEEFPCDLYLMDPIATFSDADGNGKYDSHSSLSLKLGVGRIIGSSSEIKTYLNRIHNYRTNGALVTESAYMFIDNDWAPDYLNYWAVNTSMLYSQSELCIDVNETSKANYLDKLTGTGAEYVHQMIHTYPSSMAIDHLGTTEYISTADVRSYNLKASFFNMFNCSGARYTEENLGMTFVLGTSYGLAIMGTTKTGGNYLPNKFNEALGNDYTWGKAFNYWYNNVSMSEEWKMGLCLLGDPMLKVSNETQKILNGIQMPEFDDEHIKLLENEIKNQKSYSVNKTFQDYKTTHPQFY